MIVWFVNRKNCLNILRIQKNLRHLDQPFFRREQKHLSAKVYALITAAFRVDVRSLG